MVTFKQLATTMQKVQLCSIVRSSVCSMLREHYKQRIMRTLRDPAYLKTVNLTSAQAIAQFNRVAAPTQLPGWARVMVNDILK